MRLLSRSVPLSAGVIVLLSACGGDGSSQPPAEGNAADAVTIVAGDLYFQHDGVSSADVALDVAVDAGDVTFALDNQGAVPHNIVIEGVDGGKVAEASGGAKDSGTVALEAGSYVFFCDIAGHRDAGMEGTVTVS